MRDVADNKVLYLTTIGRRTGLPREIEIWFIVYRGRFYLLAETGDNMSNLNFLWGASIGLFLWFLVCGRLLFAELPKAFWRDWRSLACLAVLSLHVGSGIVWYVTQFHGAWYRAW